MMLFPYIFVLILIGIPLSDCNVVLNHHHPNSILSKIGQFVGRRCTKNRDLDYLEKVLNHLQDFIQCLKKILPHHTDEDETFKERCFEIRQEVIQCLEKLMNALEPCLYPEEQKMTHFIIDSFKAYTEYFCNHIEILTIEGLLDSNMSKCINRFLKHPKTDPHLACFNEITLANTNDTPLTEKELCKDLAQVYTCYQDAYKTHCADAPKAWEFQGGLLNATRSPCFKS
ncbi:hypothetical protein FQA39_LY00081 [Lamprigera yunnana]|nr:hypothetical protein FQA39_LY00081 [Lamprigera yunnana]